MKTFDYVAYCRWKNILQIYLKCWLKREMAGIQLRSDNILCPIHAIRWQCSAFLVSVWSAPHTPLQNKRGITGGKNLWRSGYTISVKWRFVLQTHTSWVDTQEGLKVSNHQVSHLNYSAAHMRSLSAFWVGLDLSPDIGCTKWIHPPEFMIYIFFSLENTRGPTISNSWYSLWTLWVF